MVFMVSTCSLWLDMEDERLEEYVETVIDEIRAALDLRDGEGIDPDKVPPELLEKLGDAVMGLIHSNAERHEWMDEMMGGESSENLSEAHRWMGYRYLTGGYSGHFSMMGFIDVPFDSIPYESPEDIVNGRYIRGEISLCKLSPNT